MAYILYATPFVFLILFRHIFTFTLLVSLNTHNHERRRPLAAEQLWRCRSNYGIGYALSVHIVTMSSIHECLFFCPKFPSQNASVQTWHAGTRITFCLTTTLNTLDGTSTTLRRLKTISPWNHHITTNPHARIPPQSTLQSPRTTPALWLSTIYPHLEYNNKRP